MKSKALSFRQPWATLILEGRKTIDLRTWTTTYRGSLAIYASLDVERDACARYDVDLNTLTTGAVIGIVDLVDIFPLDQAAYKAYQKEHLGGRSFREGLYGWSLINPRPIDPPLPIRGRLKLFEVELQEPGQMPMLKSQPAPMPTGFGEPPAGGFELRVIQEMGGYRLAFSQRQVDNVPDQPFLYRQPPVKSRVMVELGGNPLKAIAGIILETLRQNGYKPTDLQASRREPFELNEESGVRLGLVFLAVKSVTKLSRIEAITQGIRAMATEEMYYWYSKCTGGLTMERAQRALRILLAEE